MIKLYHLNRIFSFLNFLLKSSSRFAVHSPFVYDFITNVIYHKTKDEKFEQVEEIRKDLLNSTSSINVIDYGTASPKSNYRRISHIAGTSLKSEKEAQFLYRLVQHYKPENILELGTSLGITTIYLALAGKASEIVTIEGCHETADFAGKHFKQLHLDHIRLIEGNIDELLPDILNSFNTLDLVFFDANHTFDATIQYFLACTAYANNSTIFVFDDIHWSAGMENAWHKIKNHLDITVTIDLFRFGLAFFRKELSKQDFVLRLK